MAVSELATTPCYSATSARATGTTRSCMNMDLHQIKTIEALLSSIQNDSVKHGDILSRDTIRCADEVRVMLYNAKKVVKNDKEKRDTTST
jgi:hypothetical protein